LFAVSFSTHGPKPTIVRIFVHLDIALAFPKARPTQKTTKQLDKALDREGEEAKGGYKLNSNWRAYYALCVADARSREDDFKNLRLEPPEVSCIRSTDAFFPRGNGVTSSLVTGRHVDLLEERQLARERRRREEQLKQEERQKARPPL
jgi:hypothetical protein